MRDALAGAQPLADLLKSGLQSGESEVDRLIDTAARKIQDKDIDVRREGLESLWDAWERLKTVLDPDKRTGAAVLLEEAIPGARLRGRVETEARELTNIGNEFRIRHSETTKEPLERAIEVEYLFHRMYAAIRLLILGQKAD